MSLRYEIPGPDSHESRASERKQNREWEALAFEAKKDDPSFKRWRIIHWSAVWIITMSVFGGLASIVLKHQEPNVFSFTPWFRSAVFASLFYIFGRWIYYRKIKKIGLERWSEIREQEFENKKS